MSDDLFDVAKSSFFHASDLDGCLVLIQGTGEVKTMKGDNGDYEIAEASVAVIDGKPSEGLTEEYGAKLPFVADEYGLMGPWLVEKVKLSTKKGKPQLGRIKGFKNTRKTMSYKLDEPTDADVAKARAAWPAVQAKLEAARDTGSPFNTD